MAAEQVNPGSLAVGVEPEGIDTAPLIRAAVIMALMVIVAVLVLFSWSNLEYQAARQAAVTESGYPALREVEAAAAGKLTRYAANDDGTYRMPVDRAIDRLVDEAYRQGGTAYAAELAALR